MKDYVRMLIEEVFDRDEAHETLLAAIEERLDYVEIAEAILDQYDLTEMAAEFLTELPF